MSLRHLGSAPVEHDATKKYTMSACCFCNGRPWVSLLAQSDDKKELIAQIPNSSVRWPEGVLDEKEIRIISEETYKTVYIRTLK